MEARKKMRTHDIVVSFVLVLILGLAGCVPASPKKQTTATSGALTMSLLMTPDPPTPMRETQAQLTLSDSRGQPVSATNVNMDLTMPGMAMPANRPQVVAAGDGVYRAKTIFSMAGTWKIEVTIAQAGATETFAFELEVK